jgi:hypothetical protein
MLYQEMGTSTKLVPCSIHQAWVLNEKSYNTHFEVYKQQSPA